MGFIEWLKSFPMDENGTPSGKITPGIYFVIAFCVILVIGLILLNSWAY